MRDTFFHEQLQFARSFKIRINEVLAEVGLYHSQWLVLFSIHRMESASMVEISNYLEVEKPTITRTMKRLEEQGFVEAITSKDKRERRMQLTERGILVYKKGHQIVSQFEADVLVDIPEEELLVAQKTMQELQEKIHRGGF